MYNFNIYDVVGYQNSRAVNLFGVRTISSPGRKTIDQHVAP
jgi:hypothetical protein